MRLFSRPYGTLNALGAIPGTEVPGYCHGVPLGRRGSDTMTPNASTRHREAAPGRWIPSRID